MRCGKKGAGRGRYFKHRRISAQSGGRGAARRRHGGRGSRARQPREGYLGRCGRGAALHPCFNQPRSVGRARVPFVHTRDSCEHCRRQGERICEKATKQLMNNKSRKIIAFTSLAGCCISLVLILILSALDQNYNPVTMALSALGGVNGV